MALHCGSGVKWSSDAVPGGCWEHTEEAPENTSCHEGHNTPEPFEFYCPNCGRTYDPGNDDVKVMDMVDVYWHAELVADDHDPSGFVIKTRGPFDFGEAFEKRDQLCCAGCGYEFPTPTDDRPEVVFGG
jgi:hypothetical protein